MNGLTLLERDHRNTERLLDQLAEASDERVGRRLFENLQRELTAHAETEEEVFYPALQDDPEIGELITKARRAHEAIDEQLMRMKNMDIASPGWAEGLQRLRQQVNDHIEEEEHDIFDYVATRLSDAAREDLNERLAQRRRRSGNGHAHDWNGAAADWVVGVARSQGQELYSSQVERASRYADDLAGALHETSEALRSRGNSTLGGYTDRAAEGISDLARSLRSTDPGELAHQVTDFARRNPALFVGGAVLTGFAISRFLKSSQSRQTHEPNVTGSSADWIGAQEHSRADSGWQTRSPNEEVY